MSRVDFVVRRTLAESAGALRPVETATADHKVNTTRTATNFPPETAWLIGLLHTVRYDMAF